MPEVSGKGKKDSKDYAKKLKEFGTTSNPGLPNPKFSKKAGSAETKRKQDLDMGTDPKTGKMVDMKKSDYKKGGKVKTKKYMAGGMAGAAPPMGKSLGGAPSVMPGGAPAMPPKMPALKKGGKVKAYKKGGKVRGAGIAKQGVRKCKMR